MDHGAWRVTLANVLAFVAGAFGVGMGASPLLQALRAHRRRSADDVSLGFLGFLAILVAGGAAWLAYGLAIGNAALIVGNAVGVVASSSAVAVALYWRGAGRQAASSVQDGSGTGTGT